MAGATLADRTKPEPRGQWHLGKDLAHDARAAFERFVLLMLMWLLGWTLCLGFPSAFVLRRSALSSGHDIRGQFLTMSGEALPPLVLRPTWASHALLLWLEDAWSRPANSAHYVFSEGAKLLQGWPDALLVAAGPLVAALLAAAAFVGAMGDAARGLLVTLGRCTGLAPAKAPLHLLESVVVFALVCCSWPLTLWGWPFVCALRAALGELTLAFRRPGGVGRRPCYLPHFLLYVGPPVLICTPYVMLSTAWLAFLASALQRSVPLAVGTGCAAVVAQLMWGM